MPCHSLPHACAYRLLIKDILEKANNVVVGDMQGLPIAQGPTDHLRDGFSSLEAKLNAPHPVQAIESRAESLDLRERLKRVRSIYGSHMAMRLATEKEVLSRPRRLPGLPSSRAGLDVVMGTENRIEFADYLNDPKNRPDAPRVDLHDVIGM